MDAVVLNVPSVQSRLVLQILVILLIDEVNDRTPASMGKGMFALKISSTYSNTVTVKQSIHCDYSNFSRVL